MSYIKVISECIWVLKINYQSYYTAISHDGIAHDISQVPKMRENQKMRVDSMTTNQTT